MTRCILFSLAILYSLAANAQSSSADTTQTNVIKVKKPRLVITYEYTFGDTAVKRSANRDSANITSWPDMILLDPLESFEKYGLKGPTTGRIDLNCLAYIHSKMGKTIVGRCFDAPFTVPVLESIWCRNAEVKYVIYLDSNANVGFSNYSWLVRGRNNDFGNCLLDWIKREMDDPMPRSWMYASVNGKKEPCMIIINYKMGRNKLSSDRRQLLVDEAAEY